MSSSSPGFDLAGAARDWDALVRLAAPLWKQPGVIDAIKLVQRNPALAPAVVAFIQAQPDATPLEQPLDWSGTGNPAA